MSVILIFILTACTLPRPAAQPLQDDLASTLVAATFQAMTQQVTPTPLPPTDVPIPLASPTASSGTVSGKVCYHDAGMVEMTVYLQNVADGKIWTQIVDRPKDSYSLEVPAGTYKVFGWPPDFTVGALVKGKATIDVAPARTLTGIDLCDYSQGPYAAPYPPGVSPSTALGSISGNIYGYSGNDRLTVVAFNKGTGYWYYVILLAGQTDYSITDLPAGRYQVVAYDGHGNTGGTDPSIYVVAGQSASADINNWGGGYPANPVH